MKIKALHSGFRMPVRADELSGGYDIFMPESGMLHGTVSHMFGMGFAAEVPPNHVALLLPRSSTGSKIGLDIRNTVGVIDSGYRGEWMAKLRLKDGGEFRWEQHERLVQFLIVPVWTPELELVEHLSETIRSTGGFGSSGK